MFRRTVSILASGMMLACTGGRLREPVAAGPDRVEVKQDSALQETRYSITDGDCRISWTVFGSPLNYSTIRHRSDCGLMLGRQAPLVAKLLGSVMEREGGAARFQTLSWGRLHPDGARDTTMAVRLVLAAKRSAEWDPVRGRQRNGDVNGWVRKLANDAVIYAEMRPVFREAGFEIEVSGVEKVLVLPARRLPFFGKLREDGVLEQDRLPFDCQLWFSLRRARPEKGEGRPNEGR